ncbi:MAG: hypothetical protein U7127_05950 [Phormidium sp.]
MTAHTDEEQIKIYQQMLDANAEKIIEGVTERINATLKQYIEVDFPDIVADVLDRYLQQLAEEAEEEENEDDEAEEE